MSIDTSFLDLGLIETVKPSNLGIGETVKVYTKKGRFMIKGIVQGVFPRLGVQISSSNPNVAYTQMKLGAYSKNTFTKDTAIIDRFDKIYDPDLYIFILEPQEEEKEVPPDNVIEVDEKKSASAKPKETKSISSNNTNNSTMNIKGSAVNVEALPKELKTKVMSFKEMDEEQVDSIISSISESALSAMKRVGIKDTMIFPKVVEIQEAVSGIFNVSEKKSK